MEFLIKGISIFTIITKSPIIKNNLQGHQQHMRIPTPLTVCQTFGALQI